MMVNWNKWKWNLRHFKFDWALPKILLALFNAVAVIIFVALALYERFVLQNTLDAIWYLLFAVFAALPYPTKVYE